MKLGFAVFRKTAMGVSITLIKMEVLSVTRCLSYIFNQLRPYIDRSLEMLAFGNTESVQEASMFEKALLVKAII